MNERVSLPRDVVDGERQPAHQPVYTTTYTPRMRYRVTCNCGQFVRESEHGWGNVQAAYGQHLIDRATRRDGKS